MNFRVVIKFKKEESEILVEILDIDLLRNFKFICCLKF